MKIFNEHMNVVVAALKDTQNNAHFNSFKSCKVSDLLLKFHKEVEIIRTTF